MKLENWSVTTLNPFVQDHARLSGEVYGHPGDRFDDGESIVTSPIKSVDGRKITTVSGSTYTLGKIEPSYRAWLKDRRPAWDWRNPVVVK